MNRKPKALTVMCLIVIFAALGLPAYGQTSESSKGPQPSSSRKAGVFEPRPAVRATILQAAGMTALRQAEVGEVPGHVSIIYNDRGASPSGSAADALVANAYVYKNDYDSGYAVFKNFEPQTGSSYPGTVIADEAILGNGFVPGGTITAYEILVFRSTNDPTCWLQNAEYDVELWDGDPFATIDTTGGGFSNSVIATAHFSDVPCGVWWLHADLDPPVVIPHDRIWIALSGNYTCRTGWRISYLTPEVGDCYRNEVDVYEVQEDSDGQFGGIGTCCTDDTTACSINSAPCANDTNPAQPRGYCADGDAENASITNFGGPCAGLPTDHCASFVANIYTTTNTWVGVLPVSSDSAGAVIDSNEITLGDSACNNKIVTFELKAHGWDHDLDGTPKLKWWEIDVLSTGYEFSETGELAYASLPCTTSADCAAGWGGRCTITGVLCFSSASCPLAPIETCQGAPCDYPEGVGGYCNPVYFEQGRPDGLPWSPDLPPFGGACEISGGFSCGSPSTTPLADNGIVWYGGTAKMTTSSDVAGTASLNVAATSFLKDADNNPIPLLGLVNAYVTCRIGACIQLAQQPFVCLSDTVSEEQCAALGGSCWAADLTCLDDFGCLTDGVCIDGDACSVNWCGDRCGHCESTPVSIGPDECCDPVPANEIADLNGLGTITNRNDNDPCTYDLCDAPDTCVLDDQCGVAINPPMEDGVPCDDGLYCTVDEICTGGDCDGGSARDCSYLNDQCNNGVCNETLNQCVKSPANQGLPCNDNLFCTDNDACTGGVCTGPAHDCSYLNDQCNQGVCNETLDDCLANPIHQGQACDDEDACTVGETCQSGVCTGGTPQDCSGAGNECNVASCDPLGVEGNCDILTPTNEGLPCDDRDECTLPDTCQDGVCSCDPVLYPSGCDVTGRACQTEEECGAPYGACVDDICTCEYCVTAYPPLADPSLPDEGFGTRVRYLAFTANPEDIWRTQAIRVTFTDLPAPFEYAEGRTMWVGEPACLCEVAGKIDCGCDLGPTWWRASRLQCEPYWTDWTRYPEVFVRNEGFVPRGTYTLQAIDYTCSPTAEENYSPALTVMLSKWGDIVGDNNQQPPDNVVDFNDIVSTIDKFMNRAGAPIKSRTDVAPTLPDTVIDFTDIPSVVDAFKGLPYPFTGPPAVDPCP